MSTPVTLRGRLTRDPEMRYSAAGKPVCKFAVVTSRRVKDQQTGEWSDADTTFWDCVAFGQTAENAAESLEKGTAVIVTGNAAQEEWTTKDGEKRRSMKVVVEDVAPSLRFHSAKVAKAARTDDGPKQAPREENSWANDEPPFLWPPSTCGTPAPSATPASRPHPRRSAPRCKSRGEPSRLTSAPGAGRRGRRSGGTGGWWIGCWHLSRRMTRPATGRRSSERPGSPVLPGGPSRGRRRRERQGQEWQRRGRREPVSTAAALFGSNSDGGVAMSEWLDVMCLGCKHERAKDRPGIGGGSGCDLVSRAICDPYTADMPEWAVDASPVPERFAGLPGEPWPACMAYEPRTARCDKGKRRGPRVSGMEPLFDLGAA